MRCVKILSTLDGPLSCQRVGPGSIRSDLKSRRAPILTGSTGSDLVGPEVRMARLSSRGSLSFMTVPPVLCAELLRGFRSLRSIGADRFGWREWKAAMASLAFSRFSAGSHVLFSSPYSFHSTRYRSLFLHILESSTASTSYSGSPFMTSGGGGSSCSFSPILFTW